MSHSNSYPLSDLPGNGYCLSEGFLRPAAVSTEAKNKPGAGPQIDHSHMRC